LQAIDNDKSTTSCGCVSDSGYLARDERCDHQYCPAPRYFKPENHQSRKYPDDPFSAPETGRNVRSATDFMLGFSIFALLGMPARCDRSPGRPSAS
jgi:hypothetical protein